MFFNACCDDLFENDFDILFNEIIFMLIITFNVNGIRAAMKKGFIDWLNNVRPDILCLQETKAMKEQVDVALIEKQGYNHYWFYCAK